MTMTIAMEATIKVQIEADEEQVEYLFASGTRGENFGCELRAISS